MRRRVGTPTGRLSTVARGRNARCVLILGYLAARSSRNLGPIESGLRSVPRFSKRQAPGKSKHELRNVAAQNRGRNRPAQLVAIAFTGSPKDNLSRLDNRLLIWARDGTVYRIGNASRGEDEERAFRSVLDIELTYDQYCAGENKR